MEFLFRQKRSAIAFDDVMKELNKVHSTGIDHIKDLNKCFDGLKSLMTRFSHDSTEFECKKCRKSGISVYKSDNDNRQTIESLRNEKDDLKKKYEDLKKKFEKENEVIQEKLEAAINEKKRLENEATSIRREKQVSFQNISVINEELIKFERLINNVSGDNSYGTDVDLSIDKRLAMLREKDTQWRHAMEKQVSCLKDDIENLHTKLDNKSKQHEMKVSEKSIEYKNILENRLHEIQEKSDRVASLETTCHDLERNMKEMKITLAERERKFIEKQEEINHMRQQLSIVQSENDNNIQKYKGLGRQLDSEKSRSLSLTEQLYGNEAMIKAIKTEYGLLSDENEELKKRIEELERKRKRNIQISIHSALKPSLSEQAVGELMSRMTERLGRDEVELDHRLYNNSDDIKGPLVVLCINVSRLGTDVKEALKGVSKGIQDVAMLVLHHKETHALPSQSSDRILTGPEYKQLGIIIDLAFLSNRGLYQCEMNNKAIERFASFLLQYRKDS